MAPPVQCRPVVAGFRGAVGAPRSKRPPEVRPSAVLKGFGRRRCGRRPEGCRKRLLRRGHGPTWTPWPSEDGADRRVDPQGRIFLMELFLIGVAQGLDLPFARGLGLIEDEEHTSRFAIDVPVTGTPLSVRVKDGETVGKPRCHLRVEKLRPRPLRDEGRPLTDEPK